MKKIIFVLTGIILILIVFSLWFSGASYDMGVEDERERVFEKLQMCI